MARIIPSPLGPFRGTIGNVESYKVGDKILGRSARCATSTPPTKEKKSQQIKFALISKFYEKVTKVISIGYRPRAKVKGIRAAIRDHINTAIIGTFPNYEINYPELHVTKSDNGFHGGFQVSLETHADSKVTINWHAQDKVREQYPGVAGPEDLVHVTFFNEKQQRAIYCFGVAERGAKTALCDLPYGLEGNVLHAYLSFTSKDGKYVSDSDYVGSFMLTNKVNTYVRQRC